MTTQPDKAGNLRLHLTNVAGAGATQLLLSLLPARERSSAARITEIMLPDRGQLADYPTLTSDVKCTRYRRRLPNALSRLLECTLFARRFDGTSALLVLGDLPLRCNARQTVFVQTPHLMQRTTPRWSIDQLKFAIARWVFRRNARYAKAFIVQTQVMKAALQAGHPQTADRIHVVAQPVPSWLLRAGLKRTGRSVASDALTLIYPAAPYPHKNHALLRQLAVHSTAIGWPVGELTLTIEPEESPAPTVPWLNCSGFLTPERMLAMYGRVDALLFLSTQESYGFPLVEAMFVGLPVVCPDLPYARALCGDGAIYFEAGSIDSLHHALLTLQQRLTAGWWPDWSTQLASLPSDWDAVARSMLGIVFGPAIAPSRPKGQTCAR
jgi:glycosyltransferase involved in cell wall biosynthesis